MPFKDKAKRRACQKAYEQTPEYKTKRKAYRRAYEQTPEYKAYRKAYWKSKDEGRRFLIMNAACAKLADL